MAENILEIKNLAVSFSNHGKRFRTVNNIELHIGKGEILGIVGESGCGKSVTSLSIMGLVPSPPGVIENGEIWLDGENILKCSEAQMRKIRGKKVSMIFQEPMTSLNPVFTVGQQIMEAIRLHNGGHSKEEIAAQAMTMLEVVGITAPERTFRSYPFQLSGGMRQRIMIAMALACRPKLLIADEPTTALDVTIQAQVLDLMRALRKEFDTAILFITHDLGVVAEMCDRVAVMYAGYVVEEAEVVELFHHPAHPYTQGLLASIPRIDEDKPQLYTIQGTVPHPSEVPGGCYFHPRCLYATDRCRSESPALKTIAPGHRVCCWRAGENIPCGGEQHG
ncbi:MAG: ABC transporter ATP-binding protein [Lawsonibacter sp.]|nr:ABC transporter ATP-binding protein [Lawsonibacter sp.]